MLVWGDLVKLSLGSTKGMCPGAVPRGVDGISSRIKRLEWVFLEDFCTFCPRSRGSRQRGSMRGFNMSQASVAAKFIGRWYREISGVLRWNTWKLYRFSMWKVLRRCLENDARHVSIFKSIS